MNDGAVQVNVMVVAVLAAIVSVIPVGASGYVKI